MRIARLKIENFRGLRAVELSDLRELVVIAGPNGIGKSTVFDAIRLLKSIYGGHQENEFHQWFAEFQVNFQGAGGLGRILRDQSRGLLIETDLTFSTEELNFVRENVSTLAQRAAWQEKLGFNAAGRSTPEALGLEHPHHLAEVNARAESLSADLLLQIELPVHRLKITGGQAGLFREDSLLTSTIFGTYEPSKLGLIDYHGPQRNYAREQVGGLNLSAEQGAENLRNHSLYNSQNKYANVKTELLSSYVRGLLADRATSLAFADQGKVNMLDETLKLLFRTFIPDKTYLGIQPMPDGSASFPVRLADGATHDIDDLSSGEKELLYGYLRIRNSTPISSILLLDEPELHLNPALARGLPAFYFDHFVREMGDQVWFVTHSDALLREAFGAPEYTVIHMRSATETTPNQAVEISDDNLESAIAALVGDLATYRPSLRVVMLEGGGDKEFDANVIRRLFPRLESLVTLISAGSKARVNETAELWRRISDSTAANDRFWAITDRDDTQGSREGAQTETWDRYHIENYLVEAEFIRLAHTALTLKADPLLTPELIESRLEGLTDRAQRDLVSTRVIEELERRVQSSLRLGGDLEHRSVAAALQPSVDSSAVRLRELLTDLEHDQFVTNLVRDIEVEIAQLIVDQGWKTVLPGREILKRYAGEYLKGISYEAFAFAIVNEMANRGFQPSGMADVLRKIAPAAVD